ncbi:POK19 protein, partial [Mionectes macconnelli]|nr:POK19 protein [Mionectes macconnelli]
SIIPQKVSIPLQVSTLNDLQKILGTLNWLRPVVGLSTDDLNTLFELLKGDPDLVSPWTLTLDAKNSLSLISNKINLFQRTHSTLRSIGPTFRSNSKLCLWEWIFLPHQFSKTLVSLPELLAKLCFKGRTRCWELSGLDPTYIYLPLTSQHLKQLLVMSLDFQIALADFSGQIKIHYPPCKFIQNINKIPLKYTSNWSPNPIPNALTVFTNGSGTTENAVIVWKKGDNWQQDIARVQGSPQLVELSAVVRALSLFSESINIVSDLAYVVGIVQQCKNSYLKDIKNDQLFQTLLFTINQRSSPFFITHICSHTILPGPIVERNRQVDLLAGSAVVPQRLEQAKLSHDFFHQSTKALQKQFALSQKRSQDTISACPDCQLITPLPNEGVNLRGLLPLQIWQTDVTHVNSFGKLKFVHVSTDTFSNYIAAMAHSGEKRCDVQRHFTTAFSHVGVPKQVKTDNGPVYVIKSTGEFLLLWGVEHCTGIPHSPAGQAVVERAHQTIQ